MRFINDLKEHKILTFGALVLLIAIIALVWYTVSSFNPGVKNDTSSEYVDIIYDPISHENYSRIDQESETQGGENTEFVYLGFGEFLTGITNNREIYQKFQEKTNSYTKEKYPNTKYISLYGDSIEKIGENSYKFVIYFDSKNPTKVLLTTEPFSVVFDES